MNVAMRATMTRIGFTAAGAQAFVDEQDISSLAEVQLMTDDEIESLCKVLRSASWWDDSRCRIGSSDPKSRHPSEPACRGAYETDGVLLASSGSRKWRSYPSGHQLNLIRTVRELREFESPYKVPMDNLPTINAKDWPKTMETVDEYLRSYLGERKIPLACVVRKNVAIPDGDDPPTNYPMIQDEMIARAPHTADETVIPDPIYLMNREKIWDVISKIT